MMAPYSWQPWFRRHLRLLFISLFIAVIVCYQTLGFFVPSTLQSMRLYEGSEREYVDANQTCKIPLLNPFERDVLFYFKPPTPLYCKSRIGMLTYIDDLGFLRYNQTAWEESGYTLDDLVCTYQEIHRGSTDDAIVYSEAKPMTGMEKPNSDFVYTSCSRTSWLPSRYSMFHAAVQRSQDVRSFTDDSELGVIVVGLDSISRLNFMRQLPRSFAVLTEKLAAFTFKGFNKVGHNTLPNIVPILMGNPPRNTSDTMTFDDWPLIWKELNTDGFATFYGEDLSRISTFSWWGAGFMKQPTTHYFRQYWLAVDNSVLNSLSSNMCLGPVPKHKIYLDYLKSFLRAYQGSPTFMFSLENEPCHDYMNLVGVVDNDLEEFLVSSYEEGLFNRTVLFIIGDHGNRVDYFRSTWQGKMEDFLPMVSMVLPPWLSAAHPHLVANLRGNSKRLASSYDLYSTFIDIFRRSSFNDKRGKTYAFPTPAYGQSLFLPIPLNRTCSDAGIPEIYCTCQEKSSALDKNDPLATKSAFLLLKYINGDVLNESSSTWISASELYKKVLTAKGENPDTKLPLTTLSQCAQLSLVTVKEAELIPKSDGSRVVRIVFNTSPNDGIYEGRVEWVTEEVGRIKDEIERTNRYGTQPDCLPKALLIVVPFVRSACYCS